MYVCNTCHVVAQGLLCVYLMVVAHLKGQYKARMSCSGVLNQFPVS
jgi:uncharacterized membrane protein